MESRDKPGICWQESRRNQSICHSDRAHPGEPAGSWARTERFAKVGDSRVPPCPNSTVFTYLRRAAARLGVGEMSALVMIPLIAPSSCT